MPRERGAVSVDAETWCRLDVKGHTDSSTQTEEGVMEGSKVHNAILCDIGDDEYDNEIAPGDVAVISNLKKQSGPQWYLRLGSRVCPE